MHSMLILIRFTSSTSDAIVSSSVAVSNMFGLFGETDTTLVWVIPRVRQISLEAVRGSGY